MSVRSPEVERAVCEALIESGAHIGNACKAVSEKLKIKITRETLYGWRRNEEFAKQFDAAMDLGVEALEDEAKNRAFNGTPEPVFYKGKKVGSIRKKSDLLLIFTLKGHRPEKYREHFEHTGANGQPLVSEVTTLEVARRIAHLLETTAEAQALAIDVTPKLIEEAHAEPTEVPEPVDD